MIEVCVAAVALIAAGVVAGFLVLVALGIHREESARSMTVPTADRVALGARVANGMHARYPGVLEEVSSRREREVGVR
jgi:hypothetical protein